MHKILSLTTMFAVMLLAHTQSISYSYGYDRKSFDDTMNAARQSPTLCHDLSKQLKPLLKGAWVKSHQNIHDVDDENRDITKFSQLPQVSLPENFTVISSTATPTLDFPPYLQRSCHVSLKIGERKFEDGFLVFAYYIHQGKMNDFIMRWDSDSVINQDYKQFQKRVIKDDASHSPATRQCRAHYPAASFHEHNPHLEEVAFDVRSRLVLRCIKDQHALSQMFSDSFFIHR